MYHWWRNLHRTYAVGVSSGLLAGLLAGMLLDNRGPYTRLSADGYGWRWGTRLRPDLSGATK